MKRIIAFDYLRTISILGIVLCHFFFNFENYVWLGGWLGSTFNVLFLILSALLLGLQWSNNGHQKLGFSFLKNRITKLSKTYYPFVFFMFLFCWRVGGYHLGIKDIIMQVLYLPWFDKIEGFGHLWFMTMIVICYFAVALLSRWAFIKNNVSIWSSLFALLISILLMYIVDSKGLPGYLFPYLLLFILFFYKADAIFRYFHSANTQKGILLSLYVVVSMLVVYFFRMPDSVEKIICMFGAISILGAFIIFNNNIAQRAWIGFFSSISFEVYLVHHVFALGRFSVMNLVPNFMIGFILLIVISIVLAWLLHLIRNFVH